MIVGITTQFYREALSRTWPRTFRDQLVNRPHRDENAPPDADRADLLSGNIQPHGMRANAKQSCSLLDANGTRCFRPPFFDRPRENSRQWHGTEVGLG